MLFFVTSLLISAVSGAPVSEVNVAQEKTFNDIQVQQQQIHRKLVNIESQLTTH